MVKFLNYLKSLNQNDKSRHSIYITYIGLKICSYEYVMALRAETTAILTNMDATIAQGTAEVASLEKSLASSTARVAAAEQNVIAKEAELAATMTVANADALSAAKKRIKYTCYRTKFNSY